MVLIKLENLKRDTVQELQKTLKNRWKDKNKIMEKIFEALKSKNYMVSYVSITDKEIPGERDTIWLGYNSIGTKNIRAPLGYIKFTQADNDLQIYLRSTKYEATRQEYFIYAVSLALLGVMTIAVYLALGISTAGLTTPFACCFSIWIPIWIIFLVKRRNAMEADKNTIRKIDEIITKVHEEDLNRGPKKIIRRGLVQMLKDIWERVLEWFRE